MRTLSSSKARQVKWITPIGVIGVGIVAAAWVMRTDWTTNPVYASCFTLGIALFNFAYLWWSGYWRLADSVAELPQGLRVRRGRHDLIISFRDIARVDYRSLHSRSVCILELHTAGELGSRIEFLPIADDESVGVLGTDLWEYLEKLVSNAQPRRTV
jgi:hypothetical protein